VYEDVSVTTVDEALSEVDRPVRLLKVDVEGREWDVLKGASGGWLRTGPFFSWNSRCRSSGASVRAHGAYRLDRTPRVLAPDDRARPRVVSPTHLDTVAYLNVLASPLQRKDPEIDGPARPPWNEGIDTTAS